MNFIGELAALATSFFFAVTVFIFTITGRMVGPQVTNRMRLLFALVYLIILNPIPQLSPVSLWHVNDGSNLWQVADHPGSAINSSILDS